LEWSRVAAQPLHESYGFGDANYAKEELRAELASVFLAAQRGIPHNPERHAIFVNSRIGTLKGDKNEIFRAAHDASVATDFILALERDRSLGEEELTNGTASTAALEQVIEAIEQDRERVEEKESESALSNAGTAVQSPPQINNERSAPVRETSEHAARYEPDSGTVNVHDKQTATDRRSTVDSPGGDSLADAKAIAKKTMGDSATTLPAQTERGAYRGSIIGETERLVIQRISGRTAIAHSKDLLDSQPQVGEKVRINYSDSKGTVREFRERAKAQDLSR
jgi:hypothetical protein